MEEDFILFKKVKERPMRNCVDLSKNMRGKRNGFIFFTESFRIDFENKMYKLVKMQEELDKKDNQVKMLDEAYSGAIKESKMWFEIAKDSVSKDKIRCISNHIEYYLLGNLRYKDSQEVFEILLKKIKEILGD